MKPTLVLGSSLGTTAATLWGPCREALDERFDVVAWDLPGHGSNHSVPDDDLSIADLAAGVLDLVEGDFHYAGDSVGGAVGLHLLLDASDRVRTATLLCTGAKIGTAESWRERIAQVRSSGTASQVSARAQSWFGPGFLERSPRVGSALLHALTETDDAAYAALCGALATFDVRDRLAEISAPVLAVAGECDVATPPASLHEIADGVRDGRCVVLPGVAHLAPAEAPDEVTRLITEHAREGAR